MTTTPLIAVPAYLVRSGRVVQQRLFDAFVTEVAQR